jgi:hypothetical protein
MTYRELLERIRQHAAEHPNDEVLDREVIIRLQTNEDNGDDLHVGGLRSISIDAGCTDEPALTLEADQEPDVERLPSETCGD